MQIFKGLKKCHTCYLHSGNVTRLLTVLRTSVGLLNVKSQHFDVLQTLKFNPVVVTYDIARAHYYWADNMGVLYKSDGQRSWTIHTGLSHSYPYHVFIYNEF